MSETVFYVNRGGNDAWSGRLAEPGATDGPFATPRRARDAVRALKKSRGGRLDAPVTVVLGGGSHYLKEALELTPEDGGSPGAPVTWRSAPDERAVLCGGQTVKGWKPWRDGIRVADLTAQRLGGAEFRQLFHRGRRQPMARYPKFDPEHPRTGGYLLAMGEGPDSARQIYCNKNDIPFDEWGDISQAELVMAHCKGYNFSIAPILDVDADRGLLTFRSVFRTDNQNARFYIRNVLGALDAPGEWFHDRKTGRLYFMPPEGHVEDGEVVVPVVDHLVHVRGEIPYDWRYLYWSRESFLPGERPAPGKTPGMAPVDHIRFEGLDFSVARQDGLRIEGARHCEALGCRAHGVGGVGFNFGGGRPYREEVGNPRSESTGGRIVEGDPERPGDGKTWFLIGEGGAGQRVLVRSPVLDCRVAGCDAWDTGSEGVLVCGEDNRAENNHICDTGLFDKACPALNQMGRRNVAARNTLHDLPRAGVYQKGADNIVELNDIRHTCLETCDGSGIRMMQRNHRLVGNVIRHNFVRDTWGYGAPRYGGGPYQAPHFAWGIYMDCPTNGVTVEGNIVARAARGGIMFNGSCDNTVVNNIVVDGGDYGGAEVNRWKDYPFRGHRIERNVIVARRGDLLAYCFSEIAPEAVALKNNVVWAADGEVRVLFDRRTNTLLTWEEWLAKGYDKGSIVADPRLTDPARDNFIPAPDSPVWDRGFKAIPVEKIGCYESRERATWPLAYDRAPRREAPVLYEPPTRPLVEDFEGFEAGGAPRVEGLAASETGAVTVTDEFAASGEKSMKVAGAPGSEASPCRFFVCSAGIEEGAGLFSADFRLDGQRPPALRMEFWQTSDIGHRPMLVGARLDITPEGRVMRGGEELDVVPLDRWFKLTLRQPVGAQSEDRSVVAVTVPGREDQVYAVPHRDKGLTKLERVLVLGTGAAESVFYVDNLYIGPEKPPEEQ